MHKSIDKTIPDNNELETGTTGDPLYKYQWYLHNTGQRVFADTLPSAGIDINIGSLHERGIRGKGIIVAVLDSGIDSSHEDLAPNLVSGGSLNFDDGSDNPIDSDGHGTKVAGIIAAAGWNGIGGRGVAPQASLKAFNTADKIHMGIPVAQQKNTIKRYLRASWGEAEQARDVDVFNNSFGLFPDNTYTEISPEEIDDWEKLMGSTRAGRGGIYVWAAGNGFLEPTDLIEKVNNGEEMDQFAGCPANDWGLSCAPMNLDFTANLVPMISVASVNARGVRSYFSSSGSSLWVSAPGGEDGYQQEFAGAGEKSYGPGILTTDISGNRGDNTSLSKNTALDGGTAADPNCDYTASFSGTSSAAPMVSGIAALMLGVNPALTQRDVKYILATTARPLDLIQPKISYAGITVEPGWIKNAAGYLFSNWYGFGLVDASAAVAMARDFNSLPPATDSGWIASTDPLSRIGDGGSAARMSIQIEQDLAVEALQFSFKTSHRQPGNLLATLTSPSGTTSYVLTPFANLRNGDMFSIPLSSSNAFLGEKAQGKWVLQLTDTAGQNALAQLQSFQMRIVGHAHQNLWSVTETAYGTLLTRPGQHDVLIAQPGQQRLIAPDTDDHHNIVTLYGDVAQGTHIWGNNNNNKIYTFEGENFVEPGRGDDQVFGGSQNDQYRHYGIDDGHDTLSDAGGERDCLQFIGISAEKIQLQRVNDDLIYLTQGNSRNLQRLVTVKDHFSSTRQHNIELLLLGEDEYTVENLTSYLEASKASSVATLREMMSSFPQQESASASVHAESLLTRVQRENHIMTVNLDGTVANR